MPLNHCKDYTVLENYGQLNLRNSIQVLDSLNVDIEPANTHVDGAGGIQFEWNFGGEYLLIAVYDRSGIVSVSFQPKQIKNRSIHCYGLQDFIENVPQEVREKIDAIKKVSTHSPSPFEREHFFG